MSHLHRGRKTAALPMNFEELKVSFALQKIPLPMKRGDSDATLSIGDLDDVVLRIPGKRSGAKAGERFRVHFDPGDLGGSRGTARGRELAFLQWRLHGPPLQQPGRDHSEKCRATPSAMGIPRTQFE